MTDDEFAAFCAEYDDLMFEMTAEGDLIVMPPAYSDMGVRNARISSQLTMWADQDDRGVVTGPSAGFVLPNGARRSPDCGWTLRSRIDDLPLDQQSKFWHLCPDFVIELQSDFDRPRRIDEKMREYLANGAQLGWLINPDKRSLVIYRMRGEPEIRTDIDSIEGEGPVAGFVLDLSDVWEPFADLRDRRQ